MTEPAPSIRIDKWLWWARFFKTRTLAARVVEGGVRINGDRTDKTKSPVRAGDTLTFAQGRAIRVIKVLALGERRGPAPEAATLYEDLSPPEPPKPRVGPRPTKKDRRILGQQMDAFADESAFETDLPSIDDRNAE